MSGLNFKLIRSFDKEYVKEEILEQMKVNEFQGKIGYTDVRYIDFLESIRKIMRMKDIASEAGIGFAVFFEGPSGIRYYISNVDH